MAIRVECYAGYRGEQEPLAFWLRQHQCPIIPGLEFADDVNRPTPAVGDFLADWLLYFVSGRSLNSSLK
jgi:hypothetical protein